MLQRLRRAGGPVATTAVVVAGLGGAVLLGLALTFWIPAGIALFAVLATWREGGQRALELVCAAVVAVVALVAVSATVRGVLSLFTDWRLPIPAGLALAFAVFFSVALWYLRGDWLRGFRASRWSWPASIAGAGVVAIVVVLGAPVIVALLREEDEDRVERSERIVSKIDAFIVADPARAGREAVPEASLETYVDAAGLAVRWSVGFATDDGVRWTLAGSTDEGEAIDALAEPDAATKPAPAPLKDADRVLLLLVDGTPAAIAGAPEDRPDVSRRREGELVARWRRVAAGSRVPVGTPSYPLLETSDEDRIAAWGRFARPGTAVRRGRAVSFQSLGSRTVTDAAVRLAVSAPSAQEDFSLALRHQPLLRFDSDEAAPRPLSIEDLFATKNVKLCFANLRSEDLEHGDFDEKCKTVASAAELENGNTHLELPLPPAEELQRVAIEERAKLNRLAGASDPQSTGGTLAEPPPSMPPPSPPPPPAPLRASRLGAGSAMYVNPVPADTEDARLLYLDYWWFLPYNPASSVGGASCGPGFVIPGISCLDHVSDWEGVTVVLDRTTPGVEPTVKAVHYAQHAGVARYEWDDLRSAWEKRPETRRMLEELDGEPRRPLVFVANGTHAAYPLPCRLDPGCRQVLEGTEENRHDGKIPWAGNVVPKCGDRDCLRLLPTARGGRIPALWNAFGGRWGDRNCWMTYYCDSSSAPQAPGQQDRYERPWDHDGTHPPATRG